MKQSVLFLALGLGAAGVFAQEVGQVISSTPIIQQVQVPRQSCQQAMVVAQPQTSGGGGVVGAIAGTALGTTIGGGSGKAAAMMLGAIGGALLGDHIEANNARQQAQAAPQCVTQVTTENRTVAYNVTYEYAGRQYTVQMPQDPGPTVQLQVRPVGASAEPQQFQPQAQTYPVAPQTLTRPGPVVMAPSIQSETVVVPYGQSAPVGTTHQVYPVVQEVQVVQQVYPVAYPQPVYRPYYYPPVGISLNLGYSRGWRHR